MKMKYELLVVTVTYKPEISDLIKFIDSYERYNDLGKSSKLVIVDNSPTFFWNISKIKSKYPDVTIVENPNNPGFGASNNIGFKLFKSDYVLFMNNDTEFVEPVFKSLIKLHESDEHIGCIGIRQLGSKLSYFKKFTTPSNINCSNFNEKYHIISGAFMFFKSNAFIECGMFDTKIFMYLEEFDISERLNRKNYHVIYASQYYFLHKKERHHKEINERLWIIGAQSQLYVCKKYGLNPRIGFYGANKRLYKYLCYYLVLFKIRDLFMILRILKYRYSILK